MIVLFAHRQRTTIAATAISVALAAFAGMVAAGDCTWQGAWLWSGKRNEPAAHRHFRKNFSADPEKLRMAAFQCASDDWADIFLNGKKIGQSRSWARPTRLGNLLPLLVKGENEIHVDLYNVASAAGLLGEIDLVGKDGSVVRIGTDKSWTVSLTADGPRVSADEIMRPPMLPYGETPYFDYATGKIVPDYPEPDISKVSMRTGALVAEMRTEKGGRHLYLNGHEEPLILYRGAINERGTATYGRFMTGFDQAGVRLAEVSLSLRQIWRPDGSIAEAELEKYVLSPLVYAPHTDLILFLNVDAPAWYVKAHPRERFAAEDGPRDFMSYASEDYRRDVSNFLSRVVAHLKTKPYYNRIAGFGLDGGEDGQFMQWTGRNRDYLGDYSEPMRRRFADEIPSAARRKGNPRQIWLDPEKDADIVRYNRVFGATPAEFMLACARAIKEASHREKLVFAYYGKFYSIAGYLEWGELALRRVLDSPDVDCLIAVEYKQRGGGLPHSFAAPVSSYTLHSKAFIDEADIRTFLDGSQDWGAGHDEASTVSIMRKMFMMTFCRGHGSHWYDLHGGMFQHPAIHREVGALMQLARRTMANAVVPAEIAVVCDEESLLAATCAIKSETSRLVLHQQNGAIGRIGAPYDLYLADDLVRAPSYRMYIFLFCRTPTAAAAAQIARIRASGATCVDVNPGEKPKTPGEYRAIAKAAGVHIYSERDDVMVYVGRGLLGVHAATAGVKKIAWPKEATFADAFTGVRFATTNRVLSLSLDAGETRILLPRQ